jgi:hypothetical protein
MSTKSQRSKTVIPAKGAAADITRILRSGKEVIKDSALGSELSESELKKHLGVGNEAPKGAPTNQAWKGWDGKAFYHFVMAEYLTPYLTNIQQMNNWNYVLFKKQRIAVERNNEIEQVAPRIKDVVDKNS